MAGRYTRDGSHLTVLTVPRDHKTSRLTLYLEQEMLGGLERGGEEAGGRLEAGTNGRSGRWEGGGWQPMGGERVEDVTVRWESCGTLRDGTKIRECSHTKQQTD